MLNPGEPSWSKRLYSTMPYFIRKNLSQRQTLRGLIFVIVIVTLLFILQLVLLYHIMIRNQNDQASKKEDVSLDFEDEILHNEVKVIADETAFVKHSEDNEGTLFDSGKVVERRGGKFLGFQKVKGASKEDFSRYVEDSSGQFTCFKSRKKIPFNQVKQDIRLPNLNQFFWSIAKQQL